MTINKAILIGTVGNIKTNRFSNDGIVCNFSIVTNEKRKDKSGRFVEMAEWHRITTFGKLAEIADNYVKKGMKVYIEGKIRYRKYTSKDNIERTACEITANILQMLSSKDKEPENRGNVAPKVEVSSNQFVPVDEDVLPF